MSTMATNPVKEEPIGDENEDNQDMSQFEAIPIKCEPTDDRTFSGESAVDAVQSQTNPNRALKKSNRKNRRMGPKVDMRAKLERSRQSARECRARKKLRYQYLEDLVSKRENANLAVKQELQSLIKQFGKH